MDSKLLTKLLAIYFATCLCCYSEFIADDTAAGVKDMGMVDAFFTLPYIALPLTAQQRAEVFKEGGLEIRGRSLIVTHEAGTWGIVQIAKEPEGNWFRFYRVVDDRVVEKWKLARRRGGWLMKDRPAQVVPE